MTRTKWEKALVERTRAFRERAGYEQQQMARLLGASVEAYRKYEERSCLPHFYVEKFCIACRITIAEFYGTTSKRQELRIITP